MRNKYISGSCTPAPAINNKRLSVKEIDSLVTRLTHSSKAPSVDSNSLISDATNVHCSPSRECGQIQHSRNHFASWYADTMEKHRTSQKRIAIENEISIDLIASFTPELCNRTQLLLERASTCSHPIASPAFQRLSSETSATFASEMASISVSGTSKKPGFSHSPCLSSRSIKIARQNNRAPHSYQKGHYMASKTSMRLGSAGFPFSPTLTPKSLQIAKEQKYSFSKSVDESISKYMNKAVQPTVSSPGEYTGPIVNEKDCTRLSLLNVNKQSKLKQKSQGDTTNCK